VDQPIIIGMLGLGGILLVSAITGKTFGDVLKGPATAFESSAAATPSIPTVTIGNVTSTGVAGVGATSQTITGKYTAAPTGSGEAAFATSFLKAIGAPQNKTSIAALEDWWAEEEGNNVLVPGHGGENNPFEVTTSGAANVPSTGNANSVGVKNYATPEEGVQAAIGYFQQYGPGVITAFQKGESISDIEAAVRDLGPNAFGSDTSTPWAD
jgi:hypothetical protein